MKKICLLFLSTLVLSNSPQAQNRTGRKIRLLPISPSPRASLQISFATIPGASTDPHPYPWPESSPEEQGLDSSVIERAYDQAFKLGYVDSLLIVKNGWLVGERYFNSRNRYSADDIRSVTKSYINSLVGIALGHGYLFGLDQKMIDFFPEFRSFVQDRRILDITIGHLLQMRAGYPFDPDAELFGQALNSKDPMKSAALWPLAADPGRAWGYSNLSSHLLSGIITKATGMSALDFANVYLCGPLGVTIQKWDRDSQGYYFGAGGMNFSPRDMARFGHLFLSNGFIDGRQILPPDWVKDSTRKLSDQVTWFQKHLTDIGYGYHWWMAKAAGVDVYFAGGHGGQNILVIPESKMVIVTTADGEVSPQQSGAQINAIYDLIANYLLSPFKALEGPGPYFPADVRASKVWNRGLAYREYVNVLTWKPNPRNAGERIVKHRIYKRTGDQLWFLTDVDAGAMEYWERKVEKLTGYTYAVSAVAADGRESVPAYVSTRYPTDWN